MPQSLIAIRLESCTISAAEGFSRHGSHRCCGEAGGGLRLQRTDSVVAYGLTSDGTDCRRARLPL
ncbi:MAG: hypothetical protein ACK6EB_09255, partial [Planctomyces sp.]